MKEQVDGVHARPGGRSARPAAICVSRCRACAASRATSADARRKLELAHAYYGRFHNVFTGPGIVARGAIEPLPLKQTMDEFRKNIIICPAAEMVDRLKRYEELGVDDFIMNVNIGHSQGESLESLERFAADVMPWFRDQPSRDGKCRVAS